VGKQVFFAHRPQQNFGLVDHDKLVTTTLSNGSTEAIHLIVADETSDTVDSEEHEVVQRRGLSNSWGCRGCGRGINC